MSYLTNFSVLRLLIIMQILNYVSVSMQLQKNCTVGDKLPDHKVDQRALCGGETMFKDSNLTEYLNGTTLTNGSRTWFESTLQYFAGATRGISYLSYEDENLFDLRKVKVYTKTKPEENPYAIALLIRDNTGEEVCSGTLLTAEWVLTAAHCFDNEAIVTVHLYGGGNSANELSDFLKEKTPLPPSAQVTESKEYMSHPKYASTSGKFSYDIGLAKGSKKFKMTSTVKTIKLATKPWHYRGYRTCYTTGFGVLMDGVDSDDDYDRKTHTFQVKKPCICNFMIRMTSKLDHDEAVGRLMCAKPRKDHGICSGDSGGGLVCEEEGEMKLRATNQMTMGFEDIKYCEVNLLPYFLLERPEECGGANVVSMFQYTYNHLPWINEHVKILSDDVISEVLKNMPSTATTLVPICAIIVKVNFALIFFLN